MIELPKFTEPAAVAPQGKSFTPAEQTERAAVLQRVGIEDARQSAITGNLKEAATDYQQAKLDGPAGDFHPPQAGRRAASPAELRRADRARHRRHAGRRCARARGARARDPAAAGSLPQWFTDKTTGLYNEAKARAQGQPFATDKFSEVLGTDSKFANTDTIELRKGIKARMQELKMIDKDGKALPATVEQAEKLRQYINEEWSPKSNGRIRELKNALDEDVERDGGRGHLQAGARPARDEGGDLLRSEGPLVDPRFGGHQPEGAHREDRRHDRGPAERAVPAHREDAAITCRRSSSPRPRPRSRRSRRTWRAASSMRRKARQAQWGAKDVTAYLNKNAVKFESVFSPEEMAKIRDLNDAGHILRVDTSYPGAAVQGHNLVQARRHGGHALSRNGGRCPRRWPGWGVGCLRGDAGGDGQVRRGCGPARGAEAMGTAFRSGSGEMTRAAATAAMTRKSTRGS
jgi:hypothetical protein